MKVILSIVFLSMTTLVLIGCGSSDAPKPSSQAEVVQFKGDPKSPDLQKVLKAHFGAGGPPPPPAAAR